MSKTIYTPLGSITVDRATKTARLRGFTVTIGDGPEKLIFAKSYQALLDKLSCNDHRGNVDYSVRTQAGNVKWLRWSYEYRAFINVGRG